MELSKAVNETSSRMDLAQSELNIYLSHHSTAVTQLNTAKQTLQATSDMLRERHTAIKDLQVNIPQTEEKLKKVNAHAHTDAFSISPASNQPLRRRHLLSLVCS